MLQTALQSTLSPVISAFARGPTAQSAAVKCINQIGFVNPTMLLVFCGGKLSGSDVLDVLKKRYGDIPIIGGAAAGGISRTGYGYSGMELTVLAILDPALTPHVFVEPNLDAGEYEAGRKLAQQMRPHFEDGDIVTLWFDSVASSNPPKLHHGSEIVAGFYEGCGGTRPQVFGGGLLTDINLSEGWVFDGSQVRHHAVVGLAWPSVLTAETIVMNGCVPASVFLEITRIDGAVVYELDGKPALEVLEGLLSYSMTAPNAAEPLSLRATLGQKQGDPYAPFSEGNYVNRLILSADRTAGSVTLFEPDFTCGSKVQVMARNNQLMIDSVRQGVETANSIVRICDSVMAVYIDCAGRASVRSGSPVEEAELLANELDKSVPLVGFYSGVEIAPFGTSPRALDWTGLLAIIRYRQ